jgi:glycerophosphoryl diester phosphodiesterase
MVFNTDSRNLDWLLKRPIAHRGLHNKSEGVIENTATAFAGAMDGNYAIECDLQITADGEAVVFHDETLDRLTTDKGLLKERTAKSLKAVNFTNSNDRMQTLGELLDQVNGKVPLVIELKSHWNSDLALAERALRLLAAYKGPYAIMSFDPDLVAAIAELSPSTVRGLTADRTVDPYYDNLSYYRRLEMRTLNLARTRPHFISFYFRELPFAPLSDYRNAGYPVITWTIRSKAQEIEALRYSDQVTFEGYAA